MPSHGEDPVTDQGVLRSPSEPRVVPAVAAATIDTDHDGCDSCLVATPAADPLLASSTKISALDKLFAQISALLRPFNMLSTGTRTRSSDPPLESPAVQSSPDSTPTSPSCERTAAHSSDVALIPHLYPHAAVSSLDRINPVTALDQYFKYWPFRVH